jgi:uncharacterized protein YdiU (UPF0061 family)
MITDWDNTYSRLPNQMYAQQMPTPVTSPSGLALNKKLADELGIVFGSDWF